MFCPQCGNKIELSLANFCHNCGFDLSVIPKNKPADPLKAIDPPLFPRESTTAKDSSFPKQLPDSKESETEPGPSNIEPTLKKTKRKETEKDLVLDEPTHSSLPRAELMPKRVPHLRMTSYENTHPVSEFFDNIIFKYASTIFCIALTLGSLYNFTPGFKLWHGLVYSFVCYSVAYRKNYNEVEWAVIGFLFGSIQLWTPFDSVYVAAVLPIVPLNILWLLPERKPEGEKPKQRTTEEFECPVCHAQAIIGDTKCSHCNEPLTWD
jgi:hypothetical protein